MKKILCLSVLLLTVSCGKNAVYQPVATNNTPTSGTGIGSGVNVGTTFTYLEDNSMVASINYQYNSITEVKELSAKQDDMYNVAVSGVVQLPQFIQVTKGWAGVNDTATIKLELIGSGTLSCVYQSEATNTHYSVSSATTGLKYIFKACSDNSTTPSSYIEESKSVSLTINKADDLFSETRVLATLKIFQ